MDRAPLPPHERPWRHPSELGPPAHEPAATNGRVLIVTTATLSLLLVGLLAVAMTPEHGAPPVAVQATTGSAGRVAALEQPPLPIVAPLGDEGWGVMSSAAVGTRSGLLAARLPSGDLVDVEIVRHDAELGITVVSVPAETPGYELATSSPAPSDTVVVQGAEPVVVSLDAVSGLDVDEGSPVLDDDGALIGICARRGDTMAVMTVTTMPGTSPTSTTAAPRPTTTVATGASSTTAVPTSTTVPSSATTTSSAPSPTTTVVTGSVPVTESSVATEAMAPPRGGGATTTAPG